jgi:hypothetical protein
MEKLNFTGFLDHFGNKIYEGDSVDIEYVNIKGGFGGYMPYSVKVKWIKSENRYNIDYTCKKEKETFKKIYYKR